MENNKFSKRLKSLLDETNTTRQQLAKAIGVSHQAVTQWSGGQTIPDIYKFRKIAEHFGVSYDYLYGDTKSRTHKNMALVGELGLSDESIDKLKELAYKNDSEIVSQIISNPRFNMLLSWAKLYITPPAPKEDDYPRFRKVSKKVESLNLINNDNFQAVLPGADIIAGNDNSEYYEYKIISIFKSILAEIKREEVQNGVHSTEEE